MKNNIKELRNKINITQSELDNKLNVSRQAINAVETGRYNSSIWVAHDIAIFLELKQKMFLTFKIVREKELNTNVKNLNS